MNLNKKRILIVDDNESIHEDIHNILDSKARKEKDTETELLERELFGTDFTEKAPDESDKTHYVIDDAYQGNEAIKLVDKAVEEGFPYALIFMDVRMPPGMDGIQAITEIWKKHPQIEMVICTAYSDYSWDQIIGQFGSTDHLLFMKKPFDSIALKQMALSLTTKWDLAKQNARYVEKLEVEIQQRTQQLSEMGEHLKKIKKDSEKLTLAKSNFFSTISSELQSPLNGILGVTDLLLDTELSEEQRSFAETIKLSGNSLLWAINDILDFSKFDASGIDYEEIVFDLRTTLESVVDLVAVAAKEKEIEITSFIDCNVRELFIGDPFKLRQILLLSFTYIIRSVEACEIVLAVSSKKTVTDKEAEIHFEISKLAKVNNDYRERKSIFQKGNSDLFSTIATGSRFPRQDQVEELVKQIGGEFFSTLHPDSETVIHFTGKFGVSRPKLHSVVLSSTIIGMRCLVISDYSIGRKVLSLHIDHWGGICKEASIRDPIVEKINLAKESSLPFDAIIIDLKNEPQEKYGSLAKEILDSCAKHKMKAPKLVCLTANAKRGDALLFGEYGYSVYLTKPIKQSQLFKSLLLVKSLKDESQFLDPATLITKHFVDEFTPDYFKVLVVDQNPQNLKMIITSLTRLKVRCDVADTRKTVDPALVKNRYDLILIDCQDFDDQDYLLLNSFKTSNPKLKIVLMVDAEDTRTQKAFEEGVVSDKLPKPVGNDNLINMLRKNLNT